MTLPPLRLGTCQIGRHRYPAIVGKVDKKTREVFICGVHIDRFCGQLSDEELRGVRIDVEDRKL